MPDLAPTPQLVDEAWNLLTVVGPGVTVGAMLVTFGIWLGVSVLARGIRIGQQLKESEPVEAPKL